MDTGGLQGHFTREEGVLSGTPLIGLSVVEVKQGTFPTKAPLPGPSQ